MTTAALTPLDNEWWTPENTAKVVSLAGFKYPRELLAGYLDVDPEHLAGPKFEEAVQRGQAIAEAAVAQALYAQAKEGKPTAVRMWRDAPDTVPYQAPGKAPKKGKAVNGETAPPPALKPLNERQQRFVTHYVLNGGNGAEAAREAGYSAKAARATASRMLTFANVAAAVEQERHRLAAKVEASTERIVEEMAYIAFADIMHFVELDEQGRPKRFDLSKLPDGASRAIAEITIEENERTYRGKTTTTRRSKLKLAPKGPLLDLLGRYRKMFVQKHEHTGQDGGPIRFEDQGRDEMEAEVNAALDEIRARMEAARETLANIPVTTVPSPPGTPGSAQ